MNIGDSKYVTFTLGGMTFEYDENKNRINIEKHGISFFERGLYYGKY